MFSCTLYVSHDGSTDEERSNETEAGGDEDEDVAKEETENCGEQKIPGNNGPNEREE